MNKTGLCLLFLILFPLPVFAQNAAAPVETAARQAFLIDANTGTILFTKDADTPVPTSSMSKMMTVYLVFEAIKDGKLSLNDTLPVSKHAREQEGSRMFLNTGQKVRVEDLIRGIIIQSGNDAAVVAAEALGSGSESTFAEMMNAKAAELGMTKSHFVNATGLPDSQHYASARDLATLALALMHDFPEDYHYFSETEFAYNGIKQGNRNPLLYHDMKVDGLKTGHTDDGGYGLTASAIRDGRRLVLVLNGMKNMQARADESAHVLDWGYREFGLYPIVKADDKLGDARVWLGQAAKVPMVASRDAAITLPRSARDGLQVKVISAQPVPAPITVGQPIGVLRISAPGMETKEIPLLAGAAVPEAPFFERILPKVRLLLGRGTG